MTYRLKIGAYYYSLAGEGDEKKGPAEGPVAFRA